MRSRLAVILFTLFAPITVPAYALFLVTANLVGGAFYIVIEASLTPLARRPIALSKKQQWLLAIPVLLAAPIATAIHLVLWFARLIYRGIISLGRWQAGTRGSFASLLCGLIWCAIAAWTTVACVNAAVGSAWIGKPVTTANAFVEILTRSRSMRELPPEMQVRRRQLIEDLVTHKEEVHEQWELILNVLQDDDSRVSMFRATPVLRKLADLPWYFDPAEISEDGADHSTLLLGPLFFVWMLLIRWPGMFQILRSKTMRICWLAVRLFVVTAAIHWIITWKPLTNYYSFWFEDVPRAFAIFSPACWLGFNPNRWVRPEWYLFNAGLWFAILLILARLWQIAWRRAPLLGWPRYYIAFLASRLLQRKRIAFFSVGAVTLCVAMMIIVISVMGGFVDSIRTRAHGLLGDLVIDAGLQGFPYYQQFIDRIAALKDKKSGRPLVVQATPIIHTYGILQFPATKKTTAVHICGIRLEEYVRVNEFGKDLFYENRYGGTRLGPQQQPVYGFNEAGLAVLPPEMEARFESYLNSLPPAKRAEEARKYRREPGDLYPGPGVFKGPEKQPGYEGRELPGVIIGRHIMANRMPSGEYRRNPKYPRGETCYITVLPLTRGGDISPEPPPKPSFRYVDDSRTGIHEIDSMNVYVDFTALQKLLSMEAQERADGTGASGARCSQIQVKLAPEFGATRETLGRTKELLLDEWDKFVNDTPADPFEYDLLRDVDIQTWEEMQRSYISAIEKEKFLVLIMFGVISIVAVFLILCIFYMIVQEKTRDIGIIKSVGGSAEGVAAVFLAYGGGIGLVGCILGSLLGTTFVEHINDVQDWLARINPDWRVWSPETYSFDKIPDVWKWSEVIWISILAVVASILGATFPALRAGRTWPVESLRYE